MATTKPRYSVLIPNDIAQSFRASVSSQYRNIPGISVASLPNLIRFVVLINAGLPENVAQRSLRRLPNDFDNRPV